MLRALADEVEAQRWGHLEELVATNTEILYMLYRFTVAANTKKGTELPPPLKITRPGRDDEVVEEVVEHKVTIHTYRRALLGGGMPDGL